MKRRSSVDNKTPDDTNHILIRMKDKLTGPSNRAEKWFLDYPLSGGLLFESLVCLIFASHSMLMRYGRDDLVEDSENHDEIFMIGELPGALSDMTEWFTIEGQQSLIVPVLFIVFGIGLFVLQTTLHVIKSPATKSATLVAMILFALIVFLVAA